MDKLKRIFYLLFVVFYSCSGTRDNQNDNSVYYSDFDVFKRQGIGEINKNKLTLPYIQKFSETDSTLTLRIFTSSKSRFEEAIIPKWDGVLVHKNYDYNDNPNQIFATIKKNRIIRYGYNNNPFYVPLDKNEEIYLHEIIPVMIEVITENSYSSLHYEVEDNNLHGSYEKMKNKIIFPFNAKSVIENNTLGENQTINRIEIENQDYSTKYFKKYRKFLNPIDPM